MNEDSDSGDNPRPAAVEKASDRFRQECVAFNLRRASRLVTRRYEEALRPLGIKAFQFTTLAMLSDRDEVPMNAIADFFGMDLSTASRNLRAMHKNDWLQVLPDATDRRRRRVLPTKEGRRLFRRAVPLWEAAQAESSRLTAAFDWPDQRRWLSRVADTASS